ncbi:MAG TPA: hypothetical protein VFU72_08300, partial [Nitrolancea sp.]|nr:hypothetical protein [Nitrolancea sp.]
MAQPMSAELLIYDLKNAADPQLSPDGTTILYTLQTLDKESKKPASQLWLRAPDGSNPRQLTRTGQRNRGGRWSPDGESIAFVSDRVGKGKAGLFVLDVARPGEAREVTRHNQELNSLAWSPDGKTIAYTTTYDPENPEETERDKDAAPPVRVTRRYDYKWDGRGYVGEKRGQIWTVDVAS